MARQAKAAGKKAGAGKAGGRTGTGEVKEGRRIPGGAVRPQAPGAGKAGGKAHPGVIRSPGMARRKKAGLPVSEGVKKAPAGSGAAGAANAKGRGAGAAPPPGVGAGGVRRGAGGKGAPVVVGRKKGKVKGKGKGRGKGRGKPAGRQARRRGALDRSGPPARWRRGGAARKGKKIPIGTRSPRFRLFIIIMVILIVVDIIFLIAVQLDWFGLEDDGGSTPRELDNVVLLDGDHSLEGEVRPNVTHVFALRVTDGSLDLDDYEVKISKVGLTFFEGVWYDANTTAGTVISADRGGGGDTAQFTLPDDPHRDPYYPAENKRVEVKIFRDGVVVWFSRWETPAGVLLE